MEYDSFNIYRRCFIAKWNVDIFICKWVQLARLVRVGQLDNHPGRRQLASERERWRGCDDFSTLDNGMELLGRKYVDLHFRERRHGTPRKCDHKPGMRYKLCPLL